MHPKFHPTRVGTHDLQTMDSIFHIPETLVLTTEPSGIFYTDRNLRRKIKTGHLQLPDSLFSGLECLLTDIVILWLKIWVMLFMTPNVLTALQLR